jgi:uncharacterized protein
MKRWLLLALALLMSLALAPIAVSGIVSDRIYHPPTALLTLDGLPASARFVDVTTVDGLALKGILVPAKPGMPLLLVFHGNASSAAGPVRWFGPLIAQGYGVLAAEYRGFSAMPGKPDEPGLERDAEAFAARARVEAKGAPLWLVGHSLGGGVALNLTRTQRFDAVVTIGTFSRIRDMAPGIARALVPDAYRNTANVARLADPYLLVHGTADDVVPAQMGGALHVAATKAGQTGASVVLDGEGHQPDARKLLAAFEALRSWRASGQWDVNRLPSAVKLVPFGATKPLNP